MPQADSSRLYGQLRTVLAATLARVPPNVVFTTKLDETPIDLVWMVAEEAMDAPVPAAPEGETTSALLDIVQVEGSADAMSSNTTPA